LDAKIAERLPVRMTWNTEYHTDVYIGIPYSYTDFILNLLDHPNIELQLEATPLANIPTIATCSIDEFYNYCFGPLEYRSLIFKHEEKPRSVQGCPQLNYVEYDIPYTRTVEHKYFTGDYPTHTIITTEYPCEWKEGMTPYYPVGDEKNRRLYKQYKKINNYVVWAGRLGTYKYMNMDEVIEQAIKVVENLK
jgi:UDP-galactopyranose mutase